MGRSSIFISYSHKNEEEKEQLVTHLRVLESEDRINVWVDDRIGAGADWEADIDQAMGEATVAILLISAEFLTSKFIKTKEVPALLQRRAQGELVVMPIIVRHCAWQTVGWLSKMNVRPENGIPIWRGEGKYANEELAKIATEVNAILGQVKPERGVATVSKPTPTPGTPVPEKERPRRDWGDVPDTSRFFGRKAERATLEQWIVQDTCRLVTLVGMGGIGKTSLAVKLCKETDAIQDKFNFIIRQTLHNAPPLSDILADLITFLSDQQEIFLPHTPEQQISRLLGYLQSQSCLLILENAEAVLQGGSQPGAYRESYEGYGELFRQVGEVVHQSCLLLTSREKPPEVAKMEGSRHPVRSLELGGLNEPSVKQLIEGISDTFIGSDEDWRTLLTWYEGNPLSLELAAKHIDEVYFGDIAEFVKDGKPVFEDLNGLLDWHFERLSDAEKEIVYWLALDREPVSLALLREDILSPEAQRHVPSRLQQLSRRVSIERTEARRFTLQPVLIEYLTERAIKQVTGRLIEQIDQEVRTERMGLLFSHALFKSLAKEYVRNSQRRFILEPIRDRLRVKLGSGRGLEALLFRILASLRDAPSLQQGYTAGNVLNLLCQMHGALEGDDFSHQTIRQAYLQGITLHKVNFAYAHFAKCTFTQSFGEILAVAFSTDGTLATADINGQIQLWRGSDLQHLLTIEAHTNWVHSVVFSPDGQMLASGSDDRTIKLWNVQDGKWLHTLQGHTGWIRCVAFHPDGHILASCSLDQTVRLWDVQGGKWLKTLEGHTDRIASIAFSPDSQTLASGSSDRTIRLWDVHTGACLKTLEGHELWIRSVAFSSDGQTLASGSTDQSVKLWDIRDGKCLNTLRGHTGWVWSVVFDPDGKTLLSGSGDRTLRLWDVQSGKCINTLQGHTKRIRSVAFSPDGQTLASGSTDQSVKLWDIRDGKCLNTLQGYTNRVRSVAFSPDSQTLTLASGSDDKTVRLWDVESGACHLVLKGNTDWVRSVAFSPDGKLLASDGADGTVQIWNFLDGTRRHVLPGHTDGIRSVAFSPDGQTLASGSADQTLRLWDAESGACRHVLEGHTNRVRSVAFSPNGKLLASGSDDKTVRLWDVESGTCHPPLLGHDGLVWSVAFISDGQTLASGSDDKTVRLWDVESGTCRPPLLGHTHWVWSVAFSPAGQTLASGSADRTVRLWDVESGACRHVLQEHSWVRSVAYSRDGRLLATGNEDHSITLWDDETKTCLKRLRIPGPYEGMNITGVLGLTEAQKNTLKNLGAVEAEM